MLGYRGGTGWETKRMDNWRGEEGGKGKGEKWQGGLERKWEGVRRVHKTEGRKERKERDSEG